MSENQVPESLHKRKQALKALDDTKRIGEQIKNQYNRLKSCREHRTDQQTNVKDLQAVQHFELLLRQQIDNLEKAERNFQILKQQYEESKNSIENKKLYVEDKLAKAKERVESQRTAKGKEELNLEKQILDLVEKWKSAKQTTGDFFPPWFEKEVHDISESLGNPKQKSETTVEMSDSNKPKVKRGVKKVDIRSEEEIQKTLESVSPPPESEVPQETTPPPPPPSPPVEPAPKKEEEDILLKAKLLTSKDINHMDPADLFAMLRPKDKNPYANVVTNTKIRKT